MKKNESNFETTLVVSVHFLICHTIVTRHLSLMLVFLPVNEENMSTHPIHGNGKNRIKNINKSIGQILYSLACVPISIYRSTTYMLAGDYFGTDA